MQCNLTTVREFLKDKLDWESKLDFLLHLDDCSFCWQAVYEARRAEHSQYHRFVKKKSKRRARKAEAA